MYQAISSSAARLRVVPSTEHRRTLVHHIATAEQIARAAQIAVARAVEHFTVAGIVPGPGEATTNYTIANYLAEEIGAIVPADTAWSVRVDDAVMAALAAAGLLDGEDVLDLGCLLEAAWMHRRATIKAAPKSGARLSLIGSVLS